MEVITQAPIYYSSAEGKKRKDKKDSTGTTGEKKSFFKKVGQSIGKAAKAVVKGIVRAEQWVVKESKVVAKGVKKKSAENKIKRQARRLKRHQAKDGQDVFKNVLQTTPAPAPGAVQIAEGIFAQAHDIDPNKPVTISTDPTSGTVTVGQDYGAREVVATAGTDGNVQYYKNSDQEGEGERMSKQTKIILIAVGSLAVIGSIYYFATRKKGK